MRKSLVPTFGNIHCRRAQMALWAFILAGLSGGPSMALASSEGKTLGFLVTRWNIAIHYGEFETDCPGGFELTSAESYLAMRSPEEQSRLLRPENAEEFSAKWRGEYTTGPNGENVCTNTRAFLNDPRYQLNRTVQSRSHMASTLTAPKTAMPPQRHASMPSSKEPAARITSTIRCIG
jgi:hypothetical protein